MSYLTGLEDRLKQGRFKLPQFQTDSPQLNQASSEAMRSNASGDIYSGAKEGVQKQVQTALPAPVEEDYNDSPYTNMQPVEKETTAVASPKTGLTPNEYELDAAKFARQAQNYGSQDIDAMRANMHQANAANNVVGTFDPTKEPVSKTRKALGMGAGIITGILGGGPLGGMKTYDAITRKPALEKEAQLEKQAKVGATNLGNAENVAKQSMANTGEINKAAGTLQNVGKDVMEQPKVTSEIGKLNAETGAIPADVALKQSTTAKNKQETLDLQNPKPTITTVPENDSIMKTTKGADGVYHSEFITKPAGLDKGIQKLSAGDEPIVRGWMGKNGHEPNQVIADYRAGDPKASALVLQALHDEALSRNPNITNESDSLSPVTDPEGKQTGFVIFNGKTGKMKPVSMEDAGIPEGSFVKSTPKDLGQVQQRELEGADNTVKSTGEIIESLFPTSKDPAIQAKGKALRNEMGAAIGRMNDILVDKIGTKNPEVAALIAKLQGSAPVFTAAMHSGRINPAFIEEFKKVLGGIGQDPENARAKLKTFQDIAGDVADEVTRLNPYTKQVASRNKAKYPKAPPIGTVEHGHKYNGGDPGKPSSWSEQ